MQFKKKIILRKFLEVIFKKKEKKKVFHCIKT